MKKTRILYGVWLVALVILLAACSLEYLQISNLGSVQTTCFTLFGMTDLLCVLMLLIGCVTIEDVPYAHEKQFRSALRQLECFLGATALYAVYCFCLDGLPHTGSITDSLAAGGLFCAAAVFSGGKHLYS
ncbi:MAG: hypothetical protein LUH00_07265 [Lachnospiraceae bacterium]|nr:hypothetical protein [Lachnospiraceae bacterium]